jgi:hypothetical protein
MVQAELAGILVFGTQRTAREGLIERLRPRHIGGPNRDVIDRVARNNGSGWPPYAEVLDETLPHVGV